MPQVITKTVIRSTDLPSSVSVTPTTAAGQLLRTVQRSNIFQANGGIVSASSLLPGAQSRSLQGAKLPFSPGDTNQLINAEGKEGSQVTGSLDPPREQQAVVASTGETPRSKRRRRRRALTICMTHCRYDIVRKTSEKFGLVEVSEDQPWNIYWTDYSVSLERAVEMRRYQVGCTCSFLYAFRSFL